MTAGAADPDADVPLRLFVAVEVPLPIRVALTEAVAPLRAAHPHARWVPVENQHISLAFLGRTEAGLRRWTEDRIAAAVAAVPAFAVRLVGLGAFSSPRRARVLWAGVEDPTSAFAHLAGTVASSLAERFPPEDRPFVPHLTLARCDPPLRLEATELGAIRAETTSFAVDQVTLFRSHLGRPAPRYEPVARFGLPDPSPAAPPDVR